MAERPVFFVDEPDGGFPSACPRTDALALYAVVDLFWRMSEWLDGQEKDAFLVWRMDEVDVPAWDAEEGEPVATMPILVVDQLPRRGSATSPGLGRAEAVAMGRVLQQLWENSLVSGICEPGTPLEKRMELFLGPAYAPIYRAQVLEKDLPARPAQPKPRF